MTWTERRKTGNTGLTVVGQVRSFDPKTHKGMIEYREGEAVLSAVVYEDAFTEAQLEPIQGALVSCHVLKRPGKMAKVNMVFAILSRPDKVEPEPEEVRSEGIIKAELRWFNTKLKYGFFKRPNKPDVFLFIDTVERCSISVDALVPERVFLIEIEEGAPKGPRVISIAFES